MSKILIGSPIRQKSCILKEFLLGLEELDKGNNEVSYYFVDDNSELSSSALLKSFAQRNTTIIKLGTELFSCSDNYDCHNWNDETLQKVTVYREFKNLLNDKEEYEKMSKASNPYGDGFACNRIADVLTD